MNGEHVSLVVGGALLLVVLLALFLRRRKSTETDFQFSSPQPAVQYHDNGENDGEVDSDDDEGDDEIDEEEETSVFDITGPDDEEQELTESEIATVIFFYCNYNEVCDDQWPVCDRVSLNFEMVRFLAVDCLHPDTAPIAAFYDVHHVPSFIVRRRGETAYHAHVGPLDETGLALFMSEGIKTNPAASVT